MKVESNNAVDPPRFCKICGAKVQRRHNYTPKSCEACQKYFRRNVSKLSNLSCLSGSRYCEIISGRRMCGKCRIEKCLRNGMKSKFIPNQTLATTTISMKSADHQNDDDGEDDEEEEIDVVSVEFVDITKQPSASTSTSNTSEKLLPLSPSSTSSPLQIIDNPNDKSFSSAEQLFKASLTGYTELSNIDQVCYVFKP